MLLLFSSTDIKGSFIAGQNENTYELARTRVLNPFMEKERNWSL